MNINKKFDRVKQWAGEKMGAEAKTNVSDQFKSLETEMALRHEGMERLHKSMTIYVKSLSTRNEGEDREKKLPVGYVGQVMIQHGEDFDSDSEFGKCLINMGRTNERIARFQESYIASATSGWLESLERSLAMMKEYQAARKKLENRRLAYDASLSKMQKSKKEDFRVEEELRSQKAKYEESSEDVLRRMQDIKEAEADSLTDLGQFLDAELEYFDRCRDELHRLKRDWPTGNLYSRDQIRPSTRSRSSTTTAHAYNERMVNQDSSIIPEVEHRQPIRSNAISSSPHYVHSRSNAYDDNSDDEARPQFRRSNTVSHASKIRESTTMTGINHNTDVATLRAGLRRTNIDKQDLFGDRSDASTMNSMSPDRSYRERSLSPATSHESEAGRHLRPGKSGSISNSRKGPPPPPPNRSKKPPPPPPVKRLNMITAGYRS